LIDTIERLNQEIALNQQVIEELLYEDPSDEDSSHEGEYVDSIAETEFSDIASVEIFELPPRTNQHIQAVIGRPVLVQTRPTFTNTLPATGTAAATSAKPQARKASKLKDY
jgi:hypothetical protein